MTDDIRVYNYNLDVDEPLTWGVEGFATFDKTTLELTDFSDGFLVLTYRDEADKEVSIPLDAKLLMALYALVTTVMKESPYDLPEIDYDQ